MFYKLILGSWEEGTSMLFQHLLHFTLSNAGELLYNSLGKVFDLPVTWQK